MRVTLNDGREFRVVWHHRYPRVTRKMIKSIPPDVDRGGTSCFLYDVNKELIHEVHLSRYYLDMFSKEVGRKYSLARILFDCDFSREERKQFWEAYFNRVQTPVAV